MRLLTASLWTILVGSIAVVVSATALASSQPSSGSATVTVKVYSLVYVEAKAAAAAVQALVKGSQAYPADTYTVVVITPDAQRQRTVFEILSQLDRPPSTRRVESVKRLSTTVFMHPDVLNNVKAISELRYPPVKVTVEASSSSLIFQGPNGTTEQAYEFAKKKLDAVSDTANLTTVMYKVNHAVPYGLPSPGTTAGTTVLDMASAASAVLQSPYPDLKITTGPANNLIVLQGSTRSVNIAKRMLGQLDQLPSQVELEVTIYALEASKLANLGYNIPSDEISTSLSEYFTPPPIIPGSSPAPPPVPAFALPGKPIRSPLNLLAQINLLDSQGYGRVLSHPTLIALSGRPATIIAGANIPFFGFSPGTTGTAPSVVQVNSTTSAVQLGTTLTMLPIVNDGGNSITLYLSPSFSSFQQFTTQGLPETVMRSAQTTINVPTGQAVVITGLNQISESDAEGYLPPFHGHWFLSQILKQHSINRDQLDIVIVIKPTVLTNITATKFAPPSPAIRSFASPPPGIPTLAPLITPPPAPSPSPRHALP